MKLSKLFANKKKASIQDFSKVAPATTPTTIRDVINSNQPNIDLTTYINENFQDDLDKIIMLNGVVKNCYVAELFLDEVNNGGLVYYYDTHSGLFKDFLVEAFTEIGDLKIAKIAKEANATILKAEKRIGKNICDNIEILTDEEVGRLENLNTLLDIDNAYDEICGYVNKHLDEKIR